MNRLLGCFFLLTSAVGCASEDVCHFPKDGSYEQVSDGSVVILKTALPFQPDRVVYGLLVIGKQTFKPERVDYNWTYSESSISVFDAVKDNLLTGSGVATPTSGIKFGPFDVQWSGKRDGSGYLMVSPEYELNHYNTHVCITSLSTQQVRKADLHSIRFPRW